jgi:hypothetical protein
MQFAKLNLHPDFFDSGEKTLLESGSLRVGAFRYASGVCGLRIGNARGEMTVLPFQGQQIWRASFCGRELTMKSAFDEPAQTADFLSTYGGFLLHCGATAMGVPSSADRHPLHGELPNMRYGEAWAGMGRDGKGLYVCAGGRARHTVAFETDYVAEPEIRLYEGETVAEVSMRITNLRSRPMEFMYLCHINFRPEDGARLVYSAPADREHVKVHFSVPETMEPAAAAALKGYMDRLAEEPALHHAVDSKTQIYDPEIVFTIKYLADLEGYAHAMQMLPGGGACYVAFRPDELPYGLRWIARTGDEDAMGLALPSTAEHLGLAYAGKHGQLRRIGAHESVAVTVKAGYLGEQDAEAMRSRIESILRR